MSKNINFVYTFEYIKLTDGVHRTTEKGSTHSTLKGAYEASQKARNKVCLDWLYIRRVYGKECTYDNSSFFQNQMKIIKIKVEI